MKFEHIVELALLLSVMWVPARLLAVRSVPTRPRGLLATALAVYAATAWWIASSYPGTLRPLVFIVLAGWLYGWYRARSRYGSRRGLPPGSLGLHSSICALVDYDFYKVQASRLGPVFKTNQFYRPVVCVVGLDRCQRFLRDHRDHLTSAPLSINRQISGGLLRYMEPDLHQRYRKLLISCMTPNALADAEIFIEERTRLEFAAMAADCAASPSSSLRPYERIDSLIYDALMRVFFGIVPEEDSSALFLDLYRTVDHHKLWHSPRKTRNAVSSIVALVRQQAERISRTTPGPSSSFLAEAIRNDPELLADPIFIENFIYFLHIARRDLTGLCGWLLKMLCDHPERGLQIRRATEEPTVASRAETAAGRFVAETLRLRQSEYLYRTTSDAIRFEGFLIPSGWLVRLCIRESHTRAEVFECPHDFDPDRFLGTTYSQQQYQPFGIYEHACMGVSVTGTISRIFVEQLVSGFDWAIVQDGPMEPGLRHHRHWRPSSRLRINLVEASLG